MSTGSAPRIHLGGPLATGAAFDLPMAQARHVQVLRLQPGASLVLFNGDGGEWRARVVRMGRADVGVEVESHVAVERELSRHVTLALGMPANERMDALVEKATELGAASIQPLLCERSVLRLSGERGARRVQHWQAVAVAACEQSGRTRVPVVHPVATLRAWLEDEAALSARDTRRFMLSPLAALRWNATTPGPAGSRLHVLSGPEGGFTTAEEGAARAAGFDPVCIGERILRADTAPLAVLAWCALA